MNVSQGLKSTSTKSMLGDDAIRYELPQSSKKMPMKLLPGPSTSSHADRVSTVNKVGKRSNRLFTNGIKEQVKGKLSLGAKILQLGGTEKVFKRIFSVREGERFLKASQCCLSTTAGPISGLLFISSDKLAFCSNRSVIKFSSPTTGDQIRFHYKVVIPLRKIKRANQSENTNKTSQKYLQLVTTDDFEFWFMAFLNYKKMFKCLQQAISQA